MVMNSISGLSREISALACARIAPGSASPRKAQLWHSDFPNVMKSAAGTPLPLTSPIEK